MMRRSVWGVILLATLLGAGCGGDSGDDAKADRISGDGNGGSSGSGASGGNGASGGASGNTAGSRGTGTDSAGSGSGAGDGDHVEQCQTNDTSCSDAELEVYASCVAQECGAAYEDCYGQGYAQGKYSGPCGDWLSCTEACGCEDTACFVACGQPPDACTSCLENATTCIEKNCPEPACFGTMPGDSSDPGTGTYTCEDLAACCASIADANTKGSCEAGYEQATMTGDVACSTLYSSFVQAQFCD